MPRDIAARILANIGTPALNILIESFDHMSTDQLNEAIDAVGFICFYNHNHKAYNTLIQYYKSFHIDDLIKWKLLRAFSSFYESYHFLKNEIALLKNSRLVLEAKRSIRLIEKRYPNNLPLANIK